MKSNVSLCTELELDGFFSVFEKSIYQDYPEYSTDLQRYYLQKEYTINHFAHWMSTGFRVVYVVKDEISDEVVGFLVGNRVYGGIGYVVWLGVVEEFRSKGIGSELIKTYEEFCKENHGHRVELMTFPRRVAFYERIGYEQISDVPNSYFGLHKVSMGKTIGEWNEKFLLG